MVKQLGNLTTETWQKYNNALNQYLRPGTLVRLHSYVRVPGLGRNAEGVVVELKRTNYRVNFGGRIFSVRPYHIAEYNTDTKAAQSIPAPVRPSFNGIVNPITSANRLMAECQVGDLVLMFRGKYHVAKITEMPHGRLQSVRAVDVTNGKSYRWDCNFYVQKLDKERFNP